MARTDISPALKLLSSHPPNAESPVDQLTTASYLTPTHLVFDRNHGPILHLREHEYQLEVGVGQDVRSRNGWGKGGATIGEVGDDGWKTKLRLDDVKTRWEQIDSICAGNRRAEMNEVRPTEGIGWGPGTISNAAWRGTRLRDVLLSLGVPDPYAVGPSTSKSLASPSHFEPTSHHPTPDPDVEIAEWAKDLHVHFDSNQPCSEQDWYGASIPLGTAMSTTVPVILAHSQNNAPLTPSHGYPLRVVVPGHIGARSVKWVHRISVRVGESNSFYQLYDYKVLVPTSLDELARLSGPEMDEFYRRSKLEGLPSLQVMGIGAAIGVPVENEVVWPLPPPLEGKGKEEGMSWMKVRGYAVGEGGIPVGRVELAAVPDVVEGTRAESPFRGEGLREYGGPSRRLSSLDPDETPSGQLKLAAERRARWVSASRLERQDAVWERGRLAPSGVRLATTGEKEPCWGWCLWEGTVTVPSREELETTGGKFAIVARAETESGVQQPRTSPWNVRGVDNRGWSVVRGLTLAKS